MARMVSGVPIDPKLPKNFDSTPNDARPASHRRWEGRPYIVTDDGANMMSSPETRASWLKAWPSGIRYSVRCLDGGAWDRSTWWGGFATLEEAIACAKSGPTWRKAPEPPEPPSFHVILPGRPRAVCRCSHSLAAHDPSPHRSCRMPGCNCPSFAGGPTMESPPARRQIEVTTVGEIIADEAARLPDLETPRPGEVGKLLKRIGDRIGQHLVELLRDLNAHHEQRLVRHPGFTAGEHAIADYAYLRRALGHFAERRDGIDDLPETLIAAVQGPPLPPDETPTERPEHP
jgi:hypothetical protein